MVPYPVYIFVMIRCKFHWALEITELFIELGFLHFIIQVSSDFDKLFEVSYIHLVWGLYLLFKIRT